MIAARISPKHKSIVVPFQADVRNLFASAKELNLATGKHLVLPHGPVETVMLRRLGFDVPAPIVSHYDWPGVSQPFDVQKKTCALLTTNQRAYVLNDKGTGKTKALLWSWDYLRSNNLAGKLLVLAPLSTLTFTWAAEILATLPHRKAVVLHGSKAKRLAKLSDKDAEIFIINHDGVEVLEQELASRTDIDTLVVDELAVFRNGQSSRMKRVKKLAVRFKWVWGATGGPIPRSPTDVWGQCQIITPTTVPKYFGRFRDELMLRSAHNQFMWFPKNDAEERAYAVMQPAVRYSLDDVTELPELIERVVDVPLGVEQARVYNALAKNAYVALKGGEVAAANAGVVLSKLLQVALGWVYRKDGSVAALDNGARIEHMLEAIDSAKRKVLVFVAFKHALAGVSKILDTEKIDHCVVSGDTPAGQRADLFNAFQNTTKYKVLVAHPQCLAHGVTLTAADTTVWLGPITSLEIFDQANARFRRVGQKHKQLLLKFGGTPAEKKLYKMLNDRQISQQKLLELFGDASE
jgi:SNF2 family DNA or RNA helicase